MKKQVITILITIFAYFPIYSLDRLQENLLNKFTILKDLKNYTGTKTVKEAVDKTKNLAILLRMLNAKNVNEAINNYTKLYKEMKSAEDIGQDLLTKKLELTDDEMLDEFAEHVAKLVLSSYRSIANALNSDIISRHVQDIRDEDPSDVLEKQQIIQLSQLIYDAIFELKKKYFDALMYYNWAQNYIHNLFAQLNLSQEQQDALIATNPPPKIEDIPKQELIQQIKDLNVEPPSIQDSGSSAR